MMTYTSAMSSPCSSDHSGEDGKPKMIMSYMNRPLIHPGKIIPKANDRDLSHLMLDHTYAKPWNAHPFSTRTKPAQTLFYQYPPRPPLVPDGTTDPQIDMTTEIGQRNIPPYDTIKARAMMTESERHVTLSRVEEGVEEWEEQVVRIGWTFAENRLFNRATRILHSDRLARLSIEGSPNEPALCRIHVDKSAKRFRQILASVHWDQKLAQWLHVTLLDNINAKYLAAYLDILQSLKAKVPTLVEKLIGNANPSAPRAALASAETANFINKRPWDPVLPSLAHHKLKKLPGSPLLLIVPSGPSQNLSNQTRRMRFWHSQLTNLGKVIPVTMHTAGGGRSVFIGQCLEHMIGATRTKAAELNSHFPNRPLVLIGWGVGAAIAMQVALVERISAIVCLGLPLTGLKGTRGDVDDTLLETRTTTMFVVGQNSTNCSIDDIEDVRERMRADTSLLVVGGADEWLRASHFKKKTEGVTQTIVDRCILDEISDFLGSTLANMSHGVDNSYGSHQRQYWPPQPIVEKKRRKRKNDDAPSAELAAAAATWTAASSSLRKEFRLMAHSPTATLMKHPTATPPPPSYPTPGGGHQTLNQLLDAVPTNMSLPLKRSYGVGRPSSRLSMNKRVRLLQGMTDKSVPAATHSPPPSGLSTVNPAKLWQHHGPAEDLPAPMGAPAMGQSGGVTMISLGLPAASTATSRPQPTPSPTGNIVLSIGSLAGLGQLQRTPTKKQPTASSSSSMLTTVPMTSLVNRTPTKMVTPVSSEQGAVLHFTPPSSTPLAASGSTLTTCVTTTVAPTIAFQSLPVRSPFGAPRSSPGAMPVYTVTPRLVSGISNASVTSTNTTSLLISNSNRAAGQPAAAGRSNEPNLEQVHAIQKLQFHDFPLTTASLTKTSAAGSPVITQAKILTNRSFDIRKLQQAMSMGGATSVTSTTSAASHSVVFGKQSFVSGRDMNTLCRLAAANAADRAATNLTKACSPVPSVSEGGESPTPAKLNFTVSSIKLHIPERKLAAAGICQSQDPASGGSRPDGGSGGKTPQVSVFMLTSDKGASRTVGGGTGMGGERRDAVSYQVLSSDDLAKQSSTLHRILESALVSQQKQVARGKIQSPAATISSSPTAKPIPRGLPLKPAEVVVPEIGFRRVVPEREIPKLPPPAEVSEVVLTTADCIVKAELDGETERVSVVDVDEGGAIVIGGEPVNPLALEEVILAIDDVGSGILPLPAEPDGRKALPGCGERTSVAAGASGSLPDPVSATKAVEPDPKEEAVLDKSLGAEQPAGTPEPITSPGRGSRFKPPPFPTISATRTRRVRPPKYMYYDL